jgi:hypothetical protein
MNISCDYCYYCNSCNSCNSCNYCYYCYSCNSCNSCYYCYSCNYCDYCDSCNYCYYCDSCNYCYSCNYCDYSYGLRMSERMLFCLGEGKYESKGAGYQKNNCIFNTTVTPDEWNTAKSSLPKIDLDICKWIEKADMTEEEKENIDGWETMGGYLKRTSYQDAWAAWWSDAKQSDKNKILELPHFNAEIFKGITGIDVEVVTEKCHPETITVDGVEYIKK